MDTSMNEMLDAKYRAAVVLLVDFDGSVWLAQRSKNCEVMKEQWECPAGKLQESEDFKTGAQRELMEETGLKVERSRLQSCGLLRTRGNGVMDVLCALFMVYLEEGEEPSNTETTKRGPWLRFHVPNELWDLELTLGTASLLSVYAEDMESCAVCAPDVCDEDNHGGA